MNIRTHAFRLHADHFHSVEISMVSLLVRVCLHMWEVHLTVDQNVLLIQNVKVIWLV